MDITYPKIIQRATPTSEGQSNGQFVPIAGNQYGAPWVVPITNSGVAQSFQTNNADAVTALSTVSLAGTVSYPYLFNGSAWDRARGGANNADAVAALTLGVAADAAYEFVWTGAAFDRKRGANVFKTVAATGSGETTVWTPTSGKKFRLMGLTVSVSGTLAGLGVQVITIKDGAGGTAFLTFNAAVGATLVGDSQMFSELGQGKLSAAANNLLIVNLGTAMASGSVAVNAWGTEE